MGVNSSIEGSNPSFSVKTPAPTGRLQDAWPLIVVPTASALDAKDGCQAGEDGNGKQNPGHDEPSLRCRGVLNRGPSCSYRGSILRHRPILPSPDASAL